MMVIYGPEYDMWFEGIDPELQAAMARAYNRWGQDMSETSAAGCSPVRAGAAQRRHPRVEEIQYAYDHLGTRCFWSAAQPRSTAATSATATTTRCGSCSRSSTAPSPPTSSWACGAQSFGHDRFDTFGEWHAVVHQFEAHGRHHHR